MKSLTRDQIVYSLDKAHPPVLEIDPGETVRFQTYDARSGTVRTSATSWTGPTRRGPTPPPGRSV